MTPGHTPNPPPCQLLLCVSPKIILLTDGQGLIEPNLVESIVESGVVISVVLIGSEANASNLAKLATSQADFYYTDSTANLPAIYLTIAQRRP
jgi:hypothetical protein